MLYTTYVHAYSLFELIGVFIDIHTYIDCLISDGWDGEFYVRGERKGTNFHNVISISRLGRLYVCM